MNHRQKRMNIIPDSGRVGETPNPERGEGCRPRPPPPKAQIHVVHVSKLRATARRREGGGETTTTASQARQRTCMTSGKNLKMGVRMSARIKGRFRGRLRDQTPRNWRRHTGGSFARSQAPHTCVGPRRHAGGGARAAPPAASASSTAKMK